VWGRARACRPYLALQTKSRYLPPACRSILLTIVNVTRMGKPR